MPQRTIASLATRASTLLACASLICACAGSPSPLAEYGPRPEADREGVEVAAIPAEEAPFHLSDDVRPTRYQLTLHVDPREERFSGRATIDLAIEAPSRRIWLHGQGLHVTRVALEDEGGTIDGAWSEADESGGTARVVLPREVAAGRARLTIDYDRAFDPALDGLYRVQVGDDFYAFTQFEAIAARKAFPCFDEPRFKVPFELTLVVPDELGAFANTRERSSRDEGGARAVEFHATEALPSYLVAFAVGPFDVVTGSAPANDVRDHALPFRGLAPRGRGPELAFAMEHTPRILTALERYTGIAYPFDKLDLVAVPDFGAGAMENPGLVTFRDQLLLLSSDPPIRQQRGFAFVMAHELAHMWFGDLVTMGGWEDLWLNEAFATWMETDAVAASFPSFEAETSELMTQLEAFEADSLASARRIRQPIASRDDISNAFDGITYSKGASILAMLEAFVGPERFRAGIRRYLAAHARGSASTDDFLRALEAEGAPAGTRATLESFTTQTGIPLVRFGAPRCGARGEAASLTLTQSRYRPRGSTAEASGRWSIPVCATYAEANGTIREACTLLDEAEGQLELASCPAWVWPNPSGRGYYRFSLEERERAALGSPLRATLSASGRAARAWQEGARGGVASTRDVLTLADSVTASEGAGELTFGDALTLLEPMAASPSRFVALAPAALYAFAGERLITDDERPSFERRARQLYAAQYRRLGFGPSARASAEPPETRALRADVLGFLAGTARDPAVLREARARGLAFLGEGPSGDHQLHPEAVSSDLVEIALHAAAREGDAALFERMLAAFAEASDGILRQRLLTALTRFPEGALRERALALVLDPRLRVNERMRLLFAALQAREGREAGWAWLRAHEPELRALLGDESSSYLPYALSFFCERERVEEGRAFFAERVAQIVGGPRNLALAAEEATLCAERAEQERESAQRYFSR